MFSTGLAAVITCHCLLGCGKDANYDSELHVNQPPVNYRYALLALLLVQMSLLQPPILP